ncbi:MAG TPA: imidazole glycerol phosphate synthase subunit HisH [Cyclobacteriaceae bacterium]
MITIINYGLGNSRSIQNMLKKIGYQSVISSEPKEIEKAHLIILPGVGAFDTGIYYLNKLALREVLDKKVLHEKTPIIGICLGMQLLTKNSEEGSLEGLGYIDANTKKFQFAKNELPVPHMGWNIVNIEKQTKLFSSTDKENRFYFVHSYFVDCRNEEDILTTTPYGSRFVSSFSRDNVIGFQFHPEKSHKFGMHLLNNLMESFHAKV